MDDDPLIRAALQRQLRKVGYEMEEAQGGAQALEYAARSAADLVILDLKMPGMSGFETCRRLKQTTGWENVPVLILTGDQDEADYEAAINAGADDFLTKPVLFQELMLRIHSLLRIQRFLSDLKASVTAIEAQRAVILQAQSMREKLQAFLIHDLKNPISSILLQAEMNLDLDSDRNSGEWGPVLHHAERLMRLVTGWLDVYRTEDAGLHPRMTEVHITPFLEDLLERHSVWFKVRRISGRVGAETGLAMAWMDPVIMERVLGNLLENCIRYSPEGGEVLIEALQTEEHQLRIEVSDQGPGVPMEVRDSIFDMYVQLAAASSSLMVRESRGLGLAFCRMAVEAHGGRIWVEDNPSGGSRFVIQMPGQGEVVNGDG